MGRDLKNKVKQQRDRKQDGQSHQAYRSKGHSERHHITECQYGGGLDIISIIALCHKCHQRLHK